MARPAADAGAIKFECGNRNLVHTVFRDAIAALPVAGRGRSHRNARCRCPDCPSRRRPAAVSRGGPFVSGKLCCAQRPSSRGTVRGSILMERVREILATYRARSARATGDTRLETRRTSIVPAGRARPRAPTCGLHGRARHRRGWTAPSTLANRVRPWNRSTDLIARATGDTRPETGRTSIAPDVRARLRASTCQHGRARHRRG